MWNNKKICRFIFAYEGRQLCYLRRYQLLNLYNVVGMWMKHDWTGCGIIMTGEFQNPQKKKSYCRSVLHKSHMDWLGIEHVPPKWQAVTNRLRNGTFDGPSRDFCRSHVHNQENLRHITTLFIVNTIRSNKQLFHYPHQKM